MSAVPALRTRATGVLVIHDGPWGRRALVAVRDGGVLSVTLARDLKSSPQSIQEIAAQHPVGRVVRVAPASETIARTTLVPAAGTPEHLASAMALLAEAQLPGAIPSYRRAAGSLGEASEGSLSVLLTGWLSTSTPDPLSSLPETWTTPIAALSALAEESAQPAVYADRRENAIAVVVPGPTRVAARVLLETSGDSASWSSAVDAALAEAAPLAGLPSAPASPPGENLRLADGRPAPDVGVSIRGIPADPGPWLEEFGIALGAAILAMDPRPTRAALAALIAAPPVVERSRLALWVEGFQSSTRCAAVIAASVALLCAGSLGLAWGRAHILSRRVAAIDKSSGGREQIEKKAELYTLLETSRLPISKLLMDISRAAPVHVTVQSLRLAPGQGLTLHGQAQTRGQVDEFNTSLSGTGVFSQVSLGRVENKGSSVEFDITAQISNPHLAVKKADDFASQTLLQRLYPDGVPPPAPPPTPATSTRHDSSREEGGPRRPAPSDGPPPPVTDAEIAAMDRAAASMGWVTRKVYIQKNPSIDSALKDRLQEEERKMHERADALKGGG